MSTLKDQKILESIAKKLGKQGVEHLKKHNEIPAVKLTDEELAFLKGGLSSPNPFKIIESLIRILSGRPQL